MKIYECVAGLLVGMTFHFVSARFHASIGWLKTNLLGNIWVFQDNTWFAQTNCSFCFLRQEPSVVMVLFESVRVYGLTHFLAPVQMYGFRAMTFG